MSNNDFTLEKLKIAENLATNTEAIKNCTLILTKLEEKVGQQNGRIAKLENWRSYVLGGAGVLSGTITFVYFIVDKIKH